MLSNEKKVFEICGLPERALCHNSQLLFQIFLFLIGLRPIAKPSLVLLYSNEMFIYMNGRQRCVTAANMKRDHPISSWYPFTFVPSVTRCTFGGLFNLKCIHLSLRSL